MNKDYFAQSPTISVRWNMAELQHECKALLSTLAKNVASLICFTLAVAGEIEGRRGGRQWFGFEVKLSGSCSVMFNSLQSLGLYSPWDSPG